MALLTAVTAGFGLIVIALFMWLIVRSFTRGELPVNSVMGIRTRTTRSSEAAWRAAHAAATPGLRVIIVVAVAGAVIPVILAVALGPDTASGARATDLAVGVAYAVVIILLVHVTVVADSAARKVER